MRLKCRLGWHTWRWHVQVRGLSRYCRCLDCGARSHNVRWFPDRFRWFSYASLTPLDYCRMRYAETQAAVGREALHA
jgi:hypothetical protein